MSVRKIEAKARWEFTCSVCKTVAVQDSEFRPSTWGRLTIERDAFDFQGNACADATVSRLLCEDCLSECSKAVNEWAKARGSSAP